MENKWCGGDFMLVEVRKRLRLLFICFCQRGFTVQQRGLIFGGIYDSWYSLANSLCDEWLKAQKALLP